MFDTVTGVSTGALIAPFAFLGHDLSRWHKKQRRRWGMIDSQGWLPSKNWNETDSSEYLSNRWKMAPIGRCLDRIRRNEPKVVLKKCPFLDGH
jgi:hypothetical protein